MPLAVLGGAAAIGCGVSGVSTFVCTGSIGKAFNSCLKGAAVTVVATLAAAGAVALLPAGASAVAVAATGYVAGGVASTTTDYLISGRAADIPSGEFAKDLLISVAIPTVVGRIPGRFKGATTGRPKQGPGRPIEHPWSDYQGSPKAGDYIADKLYESSVGTGLDEVVHTEIDAFSEDGEPDPVAGGGGGGGGW